MLFNKDFNSIDEFTSVLNQGWFSLIMIVSGTIDFTEGPSRVNLSAGNLYVIPVAAQVKADSLAVRICLLSCSADFASSGRIVRFGIGYAQTLTHQRSLVLPLGQTEARYLISLFGLLKKKFSSGHSIFQHEMVLLWVNIILYEYIELRYKYDKNASWVHHREKIVSNFITLVQRHCKEHHSVKFYADCLCVSKGHLGKSVRCILGVSAKYFIEIALVSEAYVLLSDPALSITQAAEQLHFDSSSSFSAFFKKHTKLTPTQYRLSLKF